MASFAKTVLITDLDDTLWDWVNIWYSSFHPMLVELQLVTGIPEAELLASIKAIHEKRGTSEYFFLLQDLEAAYGRPQDFESIKSKYDTVLHAFRRGRKGAQQLFPGVWNTLQHVKQSGAKIVGYTESQSYATTQRLKAFNLDGVFDLLYSPQDHDYPSGVNLEQIRSSEPANYRLEYTVHHHTPPGELKPNPGVLKSIIDDMGARNDDCVYVGDKLVKDIKMARDAGVLDAWAKYGSKIHSQEYALLKKVTHWTPTAVTQEATTKAADQDSPPGDQDVPVSITLDDSFAELLHHVRFERFTA